MIQQDRRREEVFVVRVWSERPEPDDRAWRASVTNVHTSERRFFTNYGELCEFLSRSRLG